MSSDDCGSSNISGNVCSSNAVYCETTTGSASQKTTTATFYRTEPEIVTAPSASPKTYLIELEPEIVTVAVDTTIEDIQWEYE